MWDLLILTAMDASQKESYEMELLEIPLDVVRKWAVIEDEPKTLKIGSGGSTFLCLRHLRNYFGDFSGKKILIMHSGGLSQRLPTASALGKAFLTFPNGRSMVNMKLNAYRRVEEQLGAGVVIASSDTLEHFDDAFDFRIDNSAEVVLFGHRSTTAIGEQHGVYVLEGDRLQRVLQKPSRSAMQENGAFLGDKNHVVTDSFFALRGTSLLDALLRVADSFAESEEKTEVCCYGDFLRPLGADPRVDFISKTEDPALRRWRTELNGTFHGRRTQTILLPGDDTFFHFGTTREFSQHVRPKSAFVKCFPMETRSVVFSEMEEGSFVEYCSFKGPVEIGQYCFLSNLQTNAALQVPNNTTLITIPIHGRRFVTMAFETNQPLKDPTSCWFAHHFDKPTMTWNSKLFKAEDSAEKSLETTLHAVKSGRLPSQDSFPLLSVRDVLSAKNVKLLVEWRRNLKEAKHQREE
ncbi:hypothetical protein QR680_012497 [Steinernema hermaphroditum]|uniref:GDP-fucose pyrophosphorylase domain-containing protein n=1 Tax=Steinernema hermaphroditum TaxID=289476 RepID=A0AA39I3T1_9BILA|nr:hypothetical protein QR680_012497 [Steinernema hermaphroditum]